MISVAVIALVLN